MFTTKAKSTDAAWPRGPGSAFDASDHLKIAYIKYSAIQPAKNKTHVNLIFAHGTGMNKSVWKQHIERLYMKIQDASWVLDHVVAADCCNHGDSALLNKGMIAWGADWRDAGRDLVQIVKHEAQTTGDLVPSQTTLNILVGHSYGGFSCTYAAYLEPSLFAGCIALEPVVYVESQFKDIFFARLRKVERSIIDTFDLMEAAVTYFKRESFYKTLEPAVLKDFVNDELYPSDGKIKTKASIEGQMATYCSAFYSLEFDQDVIKLLRVPYLHVVGTSAAWNLPQTVDFVKESVPSGLLECKEIKGTHLMFGENVADTVDVIAEFCSKWAKFANEHRKEVPLIKYNGDRTEIMRNMTPAILEGNYDKAFWYCRPKPNM